MRKANLIIAAGAFALIAAACSGGSDGEASVRPFSEVQATDATFENDPTFPGRGILRVDTTEPMICAIVWGETEDLGNFNNSLDMNGTGIVEHNVMLPGAEAGKTYFYRLQGSAADGTLYQSELLTFTLPPGDGTSSANRGRARMHSTEISTPSGPAPAMPTKPSSPSIWVPHRRSQAWSSSRDRWQTVRPPPRRSSWWSMMAIGLVRSLQGIQPTQCSTRFHSPDRFFGSRFRTPPVAIPELSRFVHSHRSRCPTGESGDSGYRRLSDGDSIAPEPW